MSKVEKNTLNKARTDGVDSAAFSGVFSNFEYFYNPERTGTTPTPRQQLTPLGS